MQNSRSFVSQKFDSITINSGNLHEKKIQEIRHFINAVCVVYIYYLSRKIKHDEYSKRKQNMINFKIEKLSGRNQFITDRQQCLVWLGKGDQEETGIQEE